eukprot:PhM_4_TR2130/c1_g1_i1/m.54206
MQPLITLEQFLPTLVGKETLRRDIVNMCPKPDALIPISGLSIVTTVTPTSRASKCLTPGLYLDTNPFTSSGSRGRSLWTIPLRLVLSPGGSFSDESLVLLSVSVSNMLVVDVDGAEFEDAVELLSHISRALPPNFGSCNVSGCEFVIHTPGDADMQKELHHAATEGTRGLRGFSALNLRVRYTVSVDLGVQKKLRRWSINEIVVAKVETWADLVEAAARVLHSSSVDVLTPSSLWRHSASNICRKHSEAAQEALKSQLKECGTAKDCFATINAVGEQMISRIEVFSNVARSTVKATLDEYYSKGEKLAEEVRERCAAKASDDNKLLLESLLVDVDARLQKREYTEWGAWTKEVCDRVTAYLTRTPRRVPGRCPKLHTASVVYSKLYCRA